MLYNTGIMNKAVFIFIFLMVPCITHAQTYKNPFFNNAEHQIAFNFGTGVNSGFLIPPPSQFVPFVMLNAQYSQPTTFFKLPARQSLGVTQTIGFGTKYGWQWDKYTIPIALLSMDVALFHGINWYYSTGIAVGMQAQQNERIGSKLIFGFKIAGGYRITDNTAIELFVQHYSNGNTASENNSYAFYGTGITYSF